MCGITGFIHGAFSETDLKRVTTKLKHRGPDTAGYFFDEKDHIGLGHRRLRILDLSAAANQPFYSHCRRYIMIYNGEVYNYRSIAQVLNKAKGFEPKTSSDTEVILEAYAFWGNAFVEKLNGMFAIAIWDRVAKVLLLCRDRMGIKPLFYYWKDGIFAFASEMKAIISLLDDRKMPISTQALQHILHFGFTPSTETIFSDIKKIPNGNFISITADKKFQLTPYWQISHCVTNDVVTSFTTAKQQLKIKLINAVDRRLIADVPLGTFLSGGIDSSTVTAIAQSLSKEPINTFSIGFKDNKFDESKYARSVASALGTHHNEFILDEREAIEQVDKLTSLFDEPFGDSSAIPTLLVSEMARKYVTVALSGDGGDEQFLGYGMYQWAKRIHNPLLQAFRKPIYHLLKTFGNNRLRRGAMVMNAPSDQSKQHILSQEQGFFSLREVQQLLLQPQKSTLKESWKLSRKLTAMEEQALFDLHYYLIDDLLVKVDRASMFHSLEIRVPLLDHEVLAYTVNIDRGLKINNGISKYLLKEILFDYVPRELFDRSKWGFSIPLVKWLKTDLKYLLDKYLSKAVVEQCQLVRYAVVKNLLTQYFNGQDYLYNRLWLLVQIHRFVLC